MSHKINNTHHYIDFFLLEGVGMSGLDIFAIIVLLILLVAVIAIWIVLAMLPGRIAARRNHPQAEAINIGGWLGAILGGIRALLRARST